MWSKTYDKKKWKLEFFPYKVYKNRVSIYEWLRDHDKLNSGKLLKDTFKRAINLCNLDLEKSEIEMIIN